MYLGDSPSAVGFFVITQIKPELMSAALVNYFYFDFQENYSNLISGLAGISAWNRIWHALASRSLTNFKISLFVDGLSNPYHCLGGEHPFAIYVDVYHSHVSKLPHTSSIFEGPIWSAPTWFSCWTDNCWCTLQLRTCLQSHTVTIVNLPSELLTRSNYSWNNWCFNWCYEFQPLPALQLSQLWIEPTALQPRAGRKLGIAPQELLQALQQLTDEMAKVPLMWATDYTILVGWCHDIYVHICTYIYLFIYTYIIVHLSLYLWW